MHTPVYSVFDSVSVFMALSTIFHSMNCPDKSSAFLLCSFGLVSALLVLSTMHLYESLLHRHHHLSLHRDGRWGTKVDFATSFLRFSLFSTALCDLANSRPVHSLMLSSHLFLCLPCLLPPFAVPCKMVWPDLMNGRHDRTTEVCVSLQWSRSLRVVRLTARSRHRLPRW